MTHSVFIDGAAGTTGLEIAERLAGRSEFALITLDEARRKDAAARREALNEADIAILCLPDEAARDAVALIDPASATRVIDASSAHRVAKGWTYGFPEIVGRETVANARWVSNPGCYPTGFIGLVAPLTRGGALHREDPRICYAVSGYSGGGKALIERFEADGAPAYRTYALDGHHKHLAEMGEYAGLSKPPTFVPAVVPAYRGMIVEVPLTIDDTKAGFGHAGVRQMLGDFYRGSEVVRVAPEPVETGEILLARNRAGWDSMELVVLGDTGDHVMRLVAVLDNLGKGASGAAIQNLNLMCGLPETQGLRLAAA